MQTRDELREAIREALCKVADVNSIVGFHEIWKPDRCGQADAVMKIVRPIIAKQRQEINDLTEVVSDMRGTIVRLEAALKP